MRCMECGEEKVLAEAMPAEDMAVPGFEYQTLECPAATTLNAGYSLRVA
jgi:hypothetical protein